jgi:hypothetical protein
MHFYLPHRICTNGFTQLGQNIMSFIYALRLLFLIHFKNLVDYQKVLEEDV